MTESVPRSHADEGSATWKRLGWGTAGGTLVALGLRHRSLGGYTAALAGGWMLYRGLRGGGREIEFVSLENVEASAQAVDVERTLSIEAPIEEARAFFQDVNNLDRALGEAGSIEPLDDDRQRWQVRSPLGPALSWEMHREDAGSEDEMHWSATNETEIEMSLTFEPVDGDDETDVTMALGFHPPGGSIGKVLFERLEIVPHALIGRMLRGMKTLVETGEPPALADPAVDAR